MTSPISTGELLRLHGEIERLERELSEARFDQAQASEAMTRYATEAKLYKEARRLLTAIRQNFHMTGEWADHIDAFLAREGKPVCDHDFVGASCAKCGERLYDL